MPITSDKSNVTRLPRSPAAIEYMHNQAARKLLNALRLLAQIDMDRKVTLSVRVNHDGVSVHIQAPMSEPEDAD